MSNPNRLKPKYAQLPSVSANKLPSNDTPVVNPPIKNPFVKSAMNFDSPMETPQLPQQTITQNSVQNSVNLKTCNSSSKYVRLTTEIFPTISSYINVHFPVGCILKPFGPNVI